MIFFNELYVKNNIYCYILHIHMHSFLHSHQAISSLECEHIIHIHFFLRLHIITSLSECVRKCWMWTHHTHSYFSAHAYYYVLVWMCTNMLNVDSYRFHIGMCNDVTSCSIKSYCLTLFKGIEHLWVTISLKSRATQWVLISYVVFDLQISLWLQLK